MKRPRPECEKIKIPSYPVLASSKLANPHWKNCPPAAIARTAGEVTLLYGNGYNLPQIPNHVA